MLKKKISNMTLNTEPSFKFHRLRKLCRELWKVNRSLSSAIGVILYNALISKTSYIVKRQLQAVKRRRVRKLEKLRKKNKNVKQHQRL